MNERDYDYVKITPDVRQLKHQSMEFYAFFHYSINTYTDKEWGDGTEDPFIFNPSQMSAVQWAKTIKVAKMSGAILTCKHHDGFCLWPSKYTKHSIAATPYKNGKGDVVKEVSDALRNEGLKFGIYLSPWDRNNEAYGEGQAYDNYFINQLEELLTNYGEVFTVWLDGACGENKLGKKQIYDWNRYYSLIRRLQPQACISVCGPDIRWCGNEAGDTRASEWSVVPSRMADVEKIQEESQQVDDDEFRIKKISSSDADLGSREILQKENNLIWYPAEVNTSIRPRWFYHESEDNQIKSLQEVIHIYENSVGGNATFLLNIPPTKEGRIHDNDVKRLKEFGDYLEKTYSCNLVKEAEIRIVSNNSKEKLSPKSEKETFFTTKAGETTAEFDILWKEKKCISKVVLMEQIKFSQRVEKFRILVKDSGSFRVIFEGTTIGYKKIAAFEKVYTDTMRVQILDSRVNINLHFVGVY